MTNTGMFFRMLLSAVFRRRSRAVMAVVASLVGAATLSCLAMICIAVPQQMNQEMRAYGANLIVTPLADSENGKSGIDDAMVEHTTEMVSAKGSEKHATYRYENVRVNAAPYVMAGVNPAQVRNLNHHWVVDGSAVRGQGAGRPGRRRCDGLEGRRQHHHRLPRIRQRCVLGTGEPVRY